jgi:hypothetical protein
MRRKETMPKYSKSRPNIPFDGLTGTRYDNGYHKNKVVFNILGGCDLWIRFSWTGKPVKTAVDFYVDSFKSYTAAEVIRDINDFNATQGTKTFGEWGRHFEDGVLEVWHALELPFGWVMPITALWRG